MQNLLTVEIPTQKKVPSEDFKGWKQKKIAKFFRHKAELFCSSPFPPAKAPCSVSLQSECGVHGKLNKKSKRQNRNFSPTQIKSKIVSGSSQMLPYWHCASPVLHLPFSKVKNQVRQIQVQIVLFKLHVQIFPTRDVFKMMINETCFEGKSEGKFLSSLRSSMN